MIGFPYRITVGKTIQDGNVELVTRENGDKEELTPEVAAEKVTELVKSALK